MAEYTEHDIFCSAKVKRLKERIRKMPTLCVAVECGV